MSNHKALYCSQCNFPFSKESDQCHVCYLIQNIEEHISSVLMNVIITYYSQYIFEIDDKSAAINQINGFSFRINRKHNFNIFHKTKEITFKNFYMLLLSHIESAFYDIEKTIKKCFSDDIISQFALKSVKTKIYMSVLKEIN